MNIPLIKCEIKWLIKLKIWQRIKKYIWCKWFHYYKLCWPRVDIANDKEREKHWHCAKCFPCGIAFDYYEEKLKVQDKYDGVTHDQPV